MIAHLLTFAVIGGVGFVIDAGLTLLLIGAGVSPFLARVPAIAIAMTFTWLANRRLTFKVKAARTPAEAVRYAGVAISVGVLNYLIYSALTLAGVHALAAIVVATGIAMFASYFGYRYFAFGGSTGSP